MRLFYLKPHRNWHSYFILNNEPKEEVPLTSTRKPGANWLSCTGQEHLDGCLEWKSSSWPEMDILSLIPRDTNCPHLDQSQHNLYNLKFKKRKCYSFPGSFLTERVAYYSLMSVVSVQAKVKGRGYKYWCRHAICLKGKIKEPDV